MTGAFSPPLLALDAVRIALDADVAVVLVPDPSSARLRVVARAGAAAVDLPAEILAPAVLAGSAGRLSRVTLRSCGAEPDCPLGPALIVPVAHFGDHALLVVARAEEAPPFDDDDVDRACRLAVTANGALYEDAGRSRLDALVPHATFLSALDVAAVGMSLVDTDLRYRWVNLPLCVMLERTREELMRLSVPDTVHPDHVDRALAFYDRLRHDDFGAVRDRMKFHRPDGQPVWGELGGSAVPGSGDPPLFFTQLLDVTAHQRLTDDLAYRAMHDDLTGLATRALLRDRMQLLFARVRRAGTRAMVFYLDIDRFKSINDLNGHVIGDLVLSEFARRLAATVRAGDTVARLGGDEFVIAGEATGVAEATQLAYRIHEALRPEVNIGVRTIQVEASIGVALDSPGDGPDDLIARADDALIRLKQRPQLHVVRGEPPERHRDGR